MRLEEKHTLTLSQEEAQAAIISYLRNSGVEIPVADKDISFGDTDGYDNLSRVVVTWYSSSSI